MFYPRAVKLIVGQWNSGQVESSSHHRYPGPPHDLIGPDPVSGQQHDPNAMDFRLISVRGQLSGRVLSSGLVVAERYGHGRGPGVAPGRAAGSTSGCSGQGIREGGGPFGHVIALDRVGESHLWVSPVAALWCCTR